MMAAPAPLASDASPLSVSVLLRRMAPDTNTERPALSWYQVHGLDDVHALGSITFDSRRRRPLVIVSTCSDKGLLVDVHRLAEIVNDRADVVQIANMWTGNMVYEALGRKFSVWGGAIRIMAPDAQLSDDHLRHPLITVDARDLNAPAEALSRVERMLNLVTADGGSDNGSDEVAVRLEQEKQRHQETRRELGEATKTVKALRKELVTAQAALAEDDRAVFVDTEVQFSHELWLAWLRDTEESERVDTWPLRRWRVGPQFLDSIDAQQVVDRRRVIRACVDVVTGRHAERDGRSSHKMRRAGALAQVREDGGELWRCSIADNTPSAPRLMWWKLPGGEVELAYVGLHDDFRVP